MLLSGTAGKCSWYLERDHWEEMGLDAVLEVVNMAVSVVFKKSSGAGHVAQLVEYSLPPCKKLRV